MLAILIGVVVLVGFAVYTRLRWLREENEVHKDVPCAECGQSWDYHLDQTKFIHSYTRRDT